MWYMISKQKSKSIKFNSMNRAFVFVMVLLCMCLTGCSVIGSHLGIPQEDEIHIENGFVYYIPKHATFAYLLGIQAEAGDENGLAIIPKEYNGLPISHLGYQTKIEHWSGTYYKAELTIDEDIKEVFIPSSVKHAVSSLNTNNGKIKYITNYSVNSQERVYPYYNECNKIVHIYPEHCLWEEDAFYKFSHINNDECKVGNIYFNLSPNEDSEYCYWLDYIEAKGRIRRPKDPIREGFAFTGWYTEPECVNMWDFDCEVELAYLKSENEIVDINNDGYRFSEEAFYEYRSYIESVDNHKITLYAGWEEL